MYIPYELIPMAGSLAGALGFAAWGWRSGLPARNVAGAAMLLFAAATVAGSMAIHDGEVLLNQATGHSSIPPEARHTRPAGAPVANVLGFEYDFRFYSLMLFGTYVLMHTTRIAFAAARIARGDEAARREAWQRTGIVLLLVAPIVPMHIFAVATAVLMLIGAAGLALARPVAVRTAELPQLLAVSR